MQHALLRLLVTTFVFASLCMGRQGFAEEPKPDPLVTPTTALISGAVLSISIEDELGLSHLYEIDAQGKISFQIGEEGTKYFEKWSVNVGGHTLSEARNLIVDSLKHYLKEPKVQVIVTRYPRITVRVTGAVKGNGELQLLPKANLSDIFLTIETKPEADLTKITILRRLLPDPKNPNQRPTTKSIAFDFLALQRGEIEEDMVLETGDIITIPAIPQAKPRPKTAFLRVFGEVTTEATLPISQNMTMKDVLTRVGGLKTTARRDKIRRIRGSDSRYFELNADKIEEEDPVHNQKVGDGDTIIVEARDQSLIFSIGGEVMQPKTFPWKPDEKLTLLRVLEMVGGTSPKADRRKAVIRRGYLRNPSTSLAIYCDIEEILKGRQRDWEIEAGDDILIPPKMGRPNGLGAVLPLLFKLLPFGL
jgi:protein involved in polysaccharide export with SLBB domain